MKKSYLLSLIIALCFTIQCWAQFNPTVGKMYALKENTSGLYLDIQTLGNNANSLSLNVNPTIIYFEAGGTDGTWKLKNINGTYAGVDGSNTTISSTGNDLYINQDQETGPITIAKDNPNNAKNKNFIVWPINTDITAGSALGYNKADGQNYEKLYFELVEYTYSALKLNEVHGYYSLRLNDTLYFNFTEKDDTKATLQKTPTYLYALPSANEKYLVFQDTATANALQFLGHPTGGWSTTYDCKLWQISEADENGLVTISRHADTGTDGGKEMGTDEPLLVVGLQLYTNVQNSKRWAIEGTFNLATNGTVVNNNYEFTSEKIYYYNPCNTLRFTLTESGATFQNGAKRMSLDEFYLYDAQGNEVKLTADNVSGNNNKNYVGMFDRTDGTFGGTSTWNDGTEDDYFEILLRVDRRVK